MPEPCHRVTTSSNFAETSRRSRAGLLAAVALFALFTLFALKSRADETTFRVDTELVAVDVQVLSKQTPVTDLKLEDFLVWDEGKPQQIVSMGHDEIELDLILLIDVSASTRDARNAILKSAAQAMRRLHFRDRVGIVVFNLQAYRVADPTWDRMEILNKLRALPTPSGATEISTVLRNTALYLKKASRPGARRVIVAMTDNVGYETSTDKQVREDLWETDTIVSAILFKKTTDGGEANIKTFVKDTGGESIEFREGELPLVDLFERIRKRYVLLIVRRPRKQRPSVKSVSTLPARRNDATRT